MPIRDTRVEVLQNVLVKAGGQERVVSTLMHSAPMSLAGVFPKRTAGSWDKMGGVSQTPQPTPCGVSLFVITHIIIDLVYDFSPFR